METTKENGLIIFQNEEFGQIQEKFLQIPAHLTTHSAKS